MSYRTTAAPKKQDDTWITPFEAATLPRSRLRVADLQAPSTVPYPPVFAMAREEEGVSATPRRSKRQRNEEPSAEKPRKKRAQDSPAAAGAAPEALALAVASKLDREIVLQAAQALLAHRAGHVNKRGGAPDGDVLEAAEDFLSVVVSLKRAPKRASMKPRTIPLVHPLFTPGVDDVCFFVKDPQREVKDLIEKKGVEGVTKVLGVSKLKKRYGTHEGKRELAQLYDLFLVDDRVVKTMPRLLGATFVRGKKMPLTIRMDRDVGEGVQRAIRSTSFSLSTGTTCNLRVAKASFSAEEIADNVESAVTAVAATLPGEWDAFQGLFIKTMSSPSLPVFVGIPEAKDFEPTAEEASAKRTADRLKRKKERGKTAKKEREEDVKKEREVKKKEKKMAKEEEKKAGEFGSGSEEDSEEIEKAILDSFAAGDAESESGEDNANGEGAGTDESGGEEESEKEDAHKDGNGAAGEDDSDASSEEEDEGDVEEVAAIPTVPSKRKKSEKKSVKKSDRRKETSNRPLVRQGKKEEGTPAPKKKVKVDSDVPSSKKKSRSGKKKQST